MREISKILFWTYGLGFISGLAIGILISTKSI